MNIDQIFTDYRQLKPYLNKADRKASSQVLTAYHKHYADIADLWELDQILEKYRWIIISEQNKSELQKSLKLLNKILAQQQRFLKLMST